MILVWVQSAPIVESAFAVHAGAIRIMRENIVNAIHVLCKLHVNHRNGKNVFLINFNHVNFFLFPVMMVSSVVAVVIVIAASVGVSLNSLEQHVNALRSQAIA